MLIVVSCQEVRLNRDISLFLQASVGLGMAPYCLHPSLSLGLEDNGGWSAGFEPATLVVLTTQGQWWFECRIWTCHLSGAYYPLSHSPGPALCTVCRPHLPYYFNEGTFFNVGANLCNVGTTEEGLRRLHRMGNVGVDPTTSPTRSSRALPSKPFPSTLVCSCLIHIYLRPISTPSW